jgi:ankyrin repeat protein
MTMQELIVWLKNSVADPSRPAEFRQMISEPTFDPNEPCDGRVLLAVAAELRNVDFSAALLERGAIVNVWDRKANRTPLGVAAEKGNMAVLELLLTHGADPNFVLSGSGAPALVAAAYSGQSESVLRRLLDAGANPDLGTISQKGGVSASALTVAATFDCLPAVELLLSRGANVNIVVVFGTPLTRAVEKGNYDVAKFLLEHGADPMLFAPRDDGIPMTGKTPMQIAIETKNKRMVKLLSEYDKTIAVPVDPKAPVKIATVIRNIQKAIRGSSVILNPGLKKDAFRSLQSEAGVTLPEPLRDFYLKHDGEAEESEGLMPRVGGNDVEQCFRILPFGEAIAERSYLPKLSHESCVNADLWPLAGDGSGDLMYAVIKEENVASVIQFNHETRKVLAIADSFSDWLTQGLEMWIARQDETS